MDPLSIAALLLIGGLAMKKPAPPPVPSTPRPRPEVIAIISDAAAKAGIPAYVALAFADVESGLNPTAEGDLAWHARNEGALYRQHVVGNARLAANPARDIPNAWHSYGLFQLLAPFHVHPKEHPRELLDAKRNAERGCAFIKQLLERADGDVVRARYAYVGCGLDGERCSAEHRALVKTRLEKALAKWSGVG